MSAGEKHSLITNEEAKNNDFAFIENIFQKPTGFFKDAKKKICNLGICTKIPLSLCFFIIASLFLMVLLGSFFITALLLMKSLYKEINELYFTNFVIDPIINKKTNKTETFNIRNEVLDEIYLESKLYNLQIATEFINDNLFKNEININMTSHKTNNNNFNMIMLDKNKLINGKKSAVETDQEGIEIEKDYFIYESGIETEGNDFSFFTYNLISSLTHYLKLFESNLNFNIFSKNFLSIKEIFLFNQDISNNYKLLLTYCSDWDNDNGLIEAMFNKESIFQNIINNININRYNHSNLNHFNDEENEKKEEEDFEFQDFFYNQSIDFNDYITRNDFQENINQLNLLKFTTFNITYKGNIYNFLLGIRIDSKSMKNLYNKQNSNMTTILPVTDFISENSDINSNELHLLYDNEYFNYFFEYGVKNIIFTKPLKINSQFAEEINFQNTNIDTFFQILYYYESENEYLNVLYNEVWKDEFIIIGRLIIKIIRNDDDFQNLSCGEKGKDYNNIMCNIIRDLETSQSKVIFGDIPNKKENDSIFYDLNKTAFYIHKTFNDEGRGAIYYILIKNVFTDLEKKKSNIKIIYYNTTINNLVYYNIEVLNITTYNSVKEEFIKEMDDIEFIVIIIRVGFTFIFLTATLIKITREVFSAIKRINNIISLIDMLFNKTEVKYEEDKDNEELLSNDKESYESEKEEKEEKDDLLEDQNNHDSSSERDNEEKKLLYENILENEKKKEKEKEKWSKAHVYESNFFTEGNKIIIKYTYNKLKSIFENMDNFQSEKFAEKLIFLKRRYKLNEQNEDKEDCELSSDIYQAISKISIINMEDIFYNVYYNQSYALNQSFKMFKSILDSSINKQSIPQRNNKFINFGRILKIIYYFKKEKIQKIIEIIFDKDLKYKQQIIKTKEIENEASNEIINLTRKNIRNNTRNKNGFRKSFIQEEKTK